jgi:WD40 repeat protein
VFGDGVYHMAWSPDGRLLATADDDRKVRIFDGTTGELVRQMSHTGSNYWAVEFAPDGTELASGGRDGVLRFWNPADGSLRRTFQMPDASVKSLSYSPDGRSLAAAGWRGAKVVVFDARSGAQRRIMPTAGEALAAAYSPDGTLILGADEGVVRVWDAETFVLLRSFERHRDAVFAIDFAPDGNTVATGSRDGTVRFWDPRTGAESYQIQTWEGVNGLDHSPDGQLLAVARNADVVLLYNAVTKDFLREFRFHP